jgi:hypothetical protein
MKQKDSNRGLSNEPDKPWPNAPPKANRARKQQKQE